MSPDSFHGFPNLPAEIRDLIWTATLPRGDEPAMVPYDARFQRQFRGFEPPVVPALSAPSVAFVNKEARAAVMTWARSRGLTLVRRRQTRGHAFVRPWEPQKDAVYVDFWVLHRIRYVDETFEKLFHCAAATIVHLALPAWVVYHEWVGEENEIMISILMENLPNIKRIYAIWGRLPRPSGRRNQRVLPVNPLGPDSRRQPNARLVPGEEEWNEEACVKAAELHRDDKSRWRKKFKAREPAEVPTRFELVPEADDGCFSKPLEPIYFEADSEDEDFEDYTGSMGQVHDVAARNKTLQKRLAKVKLPEQYKDWLTGEMKIEFVTCRMERFAEFEERPLIHCYDLRRMQGK